VSLNIKNPRVHDLAREAARLTGKSQTSVIEQALERLLAELRDPSQADARRQRLDLLFSEIRATVSDEDRVAMKTVAEEMYDENGLPA
jgi:antitoxin VapB